MDNILELFSKAIVNYLNSNFLNKSGLYSFSSQKIQKRNSIIQNNANVPHIDSYYNKYFFEQKRHPQVFFELTNNLDQKGRFTRLSFQSSNILDPYILAEISGEEEK